MKKYCPFCKKNVEYKIEERSIKEFKGTKINVIEKVGVCEVCNNDLYVIELEKENEEKIYEAYRKKNNIIGAKDIINLRKKYDISQRELTAILGFGKMTINRYERGAVPTKSQSDYIKLLIDNEEKFIEKVKESFENSSITIRTFEKINGNVYKKNKDNSRINNNELLKEYINFDLYNSPNIYNGYRKFDLEVVENIISYIASKVNNLSITSMNKYLWYIDMLSFNLRAVSITGLTYQKQQYGPTIIDRKYEEISKLEEKYTRSDNENKNGYVFTKIESKNNYNIDILKQNEIDIIDNIIKLFKDKKISEISDLSHKEEAWIKTNLYEKISFEYSNTLSIN